VIQRPPMASIPPPPGEPAAPAPPAKSPSSRTTIIAIVVSVAVIAILATVLALANGGGGDEASPGSSGSPSASAVAPPVDVAAHPGPFRVVLTWSAGPGAPADRIVVSRNGTVTSNLDGDATRWVDGDVVPETRYAYTVAAVGPDGTSAPVRITTLTTSAPLATAPLDGVFNVHIHATTHYGFADFGSGNGTLGWRFTPRCAHGPCATELVDLHRTDFRMTLARSGASYHGSATLHAQVRCGSAPVSSNITITVRVTEAGVVHGHWVATRVEGTMVQAEPSQLGCVASGATYDVIGRVVH
jgi:hypothetical protein